MSTADQTHVSEREAISEADLLVAAGEGRS